MKKISIIILFILLIGLLISCGESSGVEVSKLDQLRDEYAVIGQAHNHALHLIYQEFVIQKAAQQLPSTLSGCRALAADYINGANIPLLTAPLSLGNDIYSEQIIMDILEQSRLFSKSTVNADIVEALGDSLDIIQKHQAIFDSMSVILDSYISVEKKAEKLEQLYLYVDTSIENEEEKTSVMYGLSTIIHSIAYWDEHMQEWEEVLSGGMGKHTLGIIGVVGIIDGAGAVIGTLEGFRDTDPGEDGRGWTIAGRAVGEAVKTSTYAVLAIVML